MLKHDEVVNIFEQEVLFLVGAMLPHKKDFALGIRLMKLTTLVACHLSLGTEYVVRNILGETEYESLTWQKLVAHESIALMLDTPRLLFMFSSAAVQQEKTV